jgi:hypothetical protein
VLSDDEHHLVDTPQTNGLMLLIFTQALLAVTATSFSQAKTEAAARGFDNPPNLEPRAVPVLMCMSTLPLNVLQNSDSTVPSENALVAVAIPCSTSA